jgi:hypothetical protein
MFSYSLTPADMRVLLGLLLAGAIIGTVSATVRLVKEFGGIEVLF